MTDVEVLPPVKDGEPVSVLDENEIIELDKWERVIGQGLRSFVKVGNALLRIQDLRLYRADYATFAAYLRHRWGFSRQHGYQLIASAQASENVSTIGRQPDNERQARLLASLDSEMQIRVWKRALELSEAEGDKMTARLVEQAIGEIKAEDSVGKPSEKTDGDAPPTDLALRNFGKIQALASRLEGAIGRFMSTTGGNDDLVGIREAVQDTQARLQAWGKDWFCNG